MLKENNIENKQVMRKSKKEDLLPKSLFDFVQVKIALPREKQVIVHKESRKHCNDQEMMRSMELDI